MSLLSHFQIFYKKKRIFPLDHRIWAFNNIYKNTNKIPLHFVAVYWPHLCFRTKWIFENVTLNALQCTRQQLVKQSRLWKRWRWIPACCVLFLHQKLFQPVEIKPYESENSIFWRKEFKWPWRTIMWMLTKCRSDFPINSLVFITISRCERACPLL